MNGVYSWGYRWVFRQESHLLGGNDDGRELIITAPYKAKPDQAVPILQGFLDDRMSTIIKGLHDARSR